MTRKLGKDVKIARAVCRMKCGRGVKVGKVPEPKPQKGKKEVHIGSYSKGGGIYIPYNELSKEQKADIMSSGIPNVRAERSTSLHPTANMLKRMGDKTLDKLRDEGVYTRYDTKQGKKTLKYPEGKTPQKVKDMIKAEKQRRLTESTNKQKAKAEASQKNKDDKKAVKDEALKKKLMDKVNNGTERQKKASIAQLNKKFGANLTYTKPEKKAKAPKKAEEPPKPPKKIVKKVKKSVLEAKAKAKAPAKAKKAPTAKQLEARKKFSEMAKAKSKANKKSAPEPAKPAPKPKRKRRTKAEMEADKKVKVV